MCPAGTTCRPGISSILTTTDAGNPLFPPGRRSSLCSSQCPGIYGSPAGACRTSRRSTFCPVWARTTARLSAVKLLPSCIMALVTRITCGGLPGEESKREVRRARKASALPELRCSMVTGRINCRVPCGRSACVHSCRHDDTGNDAQRGKGTIGLNVFRGANGIVKIFNHESQSHPQQETPHATQAMFRGILGSTGSIGMLAGSTMLMLLDFRPARMPASLSFLSSPS